MQWPSTRVSIAISTWESSVNWKQTDDRLISYCLCSVLKCNPRSLCLCVHVYFNCSQICLLNCCCSCTTGSHENRRNSEKKVRLNDRSNTGLWCDWKRWSRSGLNWTMVCLIYCVKILFGWFRLSDFQLQEAIGSKACVANKPLKMKCKRKVKNNVRCMHSINQSNTGRHSMWRCGGRM